MLATLGFAVFLMSVNIPSLPSFIFLSLSLSLSLCLSVSLSLSAGTLVHHGDPIQVYDECGPDR
jgi:hypothetical protein